MQNKISKISTNYQQAGFCRCTMIMGVCEFVARLIMGFIAIGTGIFTLAVICNGFAWVCAGVFGMFACYRMLNEIEDSEEIVS